MHARCEGECRQTQRLPRCSKAPPRTGARLGCRPMTHFTEEQLTLAYYDELDPELRRHLDHCPECRSNFTRLKELLDAIREYPVPERGVSYGADVWVRLLPQLPVAKLRRFSFRWWMAAPALATLL